jgi:Leu/Phe-tRNA-protein transferase
MFVMAQLAGGLTGLAVTRWFLAEPKACRKAAKAA